MFYSFVVAKTHVAEEVAGRSEAVHAETKACNVLKGNVVVEQRRQFVKTRQILQRKFQIMLTQEKLHLNVIKRM